MKNEIPSTPAVSRRRFLASAGAALASTAIPVPPASAQQPAKYHRVNLMDPNAPLASYAKAITAMLKLPPSDPRNWYRNAFIHTLDCPHGNWWFLPWHRGYLGWFEQTCRELSGDPNFAFPYWDWTTLPQIPAQFFEGVLNPENDAYIASLAEFEKQLRNPMSDLWKSFSPAQLQQLQDRGFNSIDDVWQVVVQSPMFFPRGQARALTQEDPGFDFLTRKSVSLKTLLAALSPTDFMGFSSPVAQQHSDLVGASILEGQPHNHVHNNIGGFMQDNLSPVDPLFFMHHSNIDRIWDVWTRKQLEAKLPIVPTDPTELANWKKEPFLFYINAQGQSVSKNTSGDYIAIGEFDYDYQPGSGDKTPMKPSPFANKLWAGTMAVRQPNFRHSSHAMVMVPEAMADNAAQPEGQAMFAMVTLKAGMDMSDVQFDVLVNPPDNAEQVRLDDPSFAGSFSMFGMRSGNHGDKPFTFSVPISDAVAKLKAAKQFDPNVPLKVQVLASRKGIALMPLEIHVADISVGAF